MSAGNGIVALVLRSPLHRLLSRSVMLVRFRGRRSGRELTTPVQYAERGDDLVVMAGRSSAKSWWRNFRSEYEIQVFVHGGWQTMTARVVSADDEPETARMLRATYAARFPRAKLEDAAIVWCRPR